MAPAQASSGFGVVVPMNRRPGATFSTQSGLQIGIDTVWAGRRGYRPVQVTATAAKPVTADTLVAIRFYAGGGRRNSQAISVEYDFELSQGLTTNTATFLVPQYTDWNSMGWEVWVDGVKDEQLSLSSTGFNAGPMGSAATGVLMKNLGLINPTRLLSAASNNAPDEVDLSSDNLPTRWLGYSSLDVVTTSIEALQSVRRSSPKEFAELLRWIRAGGNLWVLGLGQDFAALAEVEEVLNTTRVVESSGATAAQHGWHFLALEGSGRSRLNDCVTMTMEKSSQLGVLSPSEILDSQIPEAAVDSRQWFVARAYGFGNVVALQTHGDVRTATTLQRSSLAKNLPWTMRHGNDPGSGNPHFNNWLIPDVGTAPVFEFQMLISLFVIGIGPLNYWLLRRRNQLPLLLVTVPVAAIVATLLLFTYGFLADGIGVRVRARSVTMLDQRAGEVASWARLSYFAGFAPSQGLQMPEETAIYPILPARSGNSSFGRRRMNQQRSLEWKSQQPNQHFKRGWLASRTPTQYLAITARATSKHLQIDAETDQIAVTNHLGTPILALVVEDKEGNIFSCDRIAAESSAQLVSSNYVAGSSKLRQLLTENLPQLPAGYVESKRSRRGDSSVTATESLMELQLEAIVSPVALGWGKGTYVAVTEGGVEMPLGIDGATESNSFHVVRGIW